MEFDPVCATHGSYAEVLTLSHLRYPSAKTIRAGLTGHPRLAASIEGSNCGGVSVGGPSGGRQSQLDSTRCGLQVRQPTQVLSIVISAVIAIA